MKSIFTKHPHSVGESYWQHFKFATIFGGKMFFAGIACLLHAIFPFLFVNTGSNCLLELMENYIKRTPTSEERLVRLARQLREKV